MGIIYDYQCDDKIIVIKEFEDYRDSGSRLKVGTKGRVVLDQGRYGELRSEDYGVKIQVGGYRGEWVVPRDCIKLRIDELGGVRVLGNGQGQGPLRKSQGRSLGVMAEMRIRKQLNDLAENGMLTVEIAPHYRADFIVCDDGAGGKVLKEVKIGGWNIEI